MFDVKRVILQDGDILFVGHYDIKDDNLISALTSFFDPARHSQKSHDDVNFVFFMLEAVIPACYEKTSIVFDDDQIPPFGFYSSFYDFHSNKRAFQPPERSLII
ncbi:MAG TPA: hypothetical protein VEB40_06770 [Flavipsychrobacter sp.]|nr:hypothetical protein [Flavipsychrobacter sp.]